MSSPVELPQETPSLAPQGPTRFWGSPQFPTGTPSPVCGPGYPGDRHVCAPGDRIYTPAEGGIGGGVSRIQKVLGSKHQTEK